MLHFKGSRNESKHWNQKLYLRKCNLHFSGTYLVHILVHNLQNNISDLNQVYLLGIL